MDGMPPALTWASEHSTNAALCSSTLQRAISSARPAGPSLPPVRPGPLPSGAERSKRVRCAGLRPDGSTGTAAGPFQWRGDEGHHCRVSQALSASKPFTDVASSVSACGRGGRVTRVKILSGEPGLRAANRPRQLKQHWRWPRHDGRHARYDNSRYETQVHAPSPSEVLLGTERGSRYLQSALCSCLRVPAPGTSPDSAFFAFFAISFLLQWTRWGPCPPMRVRTGKRFCLFLQALTQSCRRRPIRKIVGQGQNVDSLRVLESVTASKSRSQCRCRDTLPGGQGTALHRDPSSPP